MKRWGVCVEDRETGKIVYSARTFWTHNRARHFATHKQWIFDWIEPYRHDVKVYDRRVVQ